MQRHTDTFSTYKVTGWQEQKQSGWQIRTWPADKDYPEHEYWVIEDKFYEIGFALLFSYPGRHEPEFGLRRDLTVMPEEKAAVLHLISKWDGEVKADAPNHW